MGALDKVGRDARVEHAVAPAGHDVDCGLFHRSKELDCFACGSQGQISMRGLLSEIPLRIFPRPNHRTMQPSGFTGVFLVTNLACGRIPPVS
jgi:hypothetical protein